MGKNNQALKMEIGDIVFVKQLDPISLVIRWLEKSPYSHVALAVGSNQIIEADILQRIRVKKLNYTSYKLMRTELTNQQKKELLHCAKSFVGKKYNYAGAVKWFFRLMVNGKKYRNYPQRVYCSELVDYIFRCIGVVFFPDRPPGEILPSELIKSPLLKEPG